MTHDDRLAALASRGFTGRNARFLALALLHSGYFLRRQHAAFLRVVDGSRTTDFLNHLLSAHLATRHVYAGQTGVYHARSSALYEAIGEPNSRLRRPADPLVITQRLMTLDVLIAHREMPCLSTEPEKVRFFREVHGVPAQDLPGRLYHSDQGGVAPTTRHFVDRVPILVGAHDVTFVFVLGWVPVGAFAAFLNAYAPLLRQLRQARVLFCTADPAVIERARRMCDRRFAAPILGPSVEDPAAVLAHFRARQRFERREFRSFTDADREQLRRDLAHFSGPLYERWYAQWCLQGDTVPPPAALSTDARPEQPDVRFVPFLLDHRYPFTGRQQEAA